MLPTTYSFFTGALAALYAVAGMFFLSFWRRTRDALFASFALAFALLAINQVVLALGGLEREEQSWVYVLRLLAFLLIIAGIARKNLEGRRR
ncbi:DUF5985 family protein [Azospirillum sp. CT11-132]|jgi:uncharacterized membrane protein|uniref:DUF5985 family protein n=1 Tax=unclassified Azospirillum TaxID=2630922 RepID=UPI000D6202A9|nr:MULTISPECIES: DUF5985 family protein [unclassified Azospirillum]MCM8737038.1 DUF5985 family protein [Azospirillum sp. A1-3]PWC89275.1 hypothetical protein TSO5_21700 [Azospirillum sp. TSO5]QCG95673.1 hypothetical protein E6C67_17845 [Azospirillum sp. TSA2s]